MAQSARTKHLKALGLPDTADDASIKKAFRKLALMYHPDRNPTNVEEATERFKQINEANTYLTSAAGRVRTPPTAPEPAPTRPPPRRRPPAPHRPPPSEKPKPKPTEEEADLKRAQRHHAAAEARRQVQERETRRRASAAAARKREADDLAAQMAANEKRQNDRQRKDSINAAKAREAERNRQQEKLRNEARVKREREEEIRRRRQESEDREQERIRRERFEVHAREAREREQQREAARAEKLRRARSDPTPFSRHDDDIETHDMTEDDEAWWRSQQKNNTRGMSTSAWRTEPEEEDPEEAARRAHAEAFAAAARARSAGELAEAERLYAKAQQQMDAARDHRKKQTEAAAKKAREEAWHSNDGFYKECASAAAEALNNNEELDNLMKKFGGTSPLGRTFVAHSNGTIRPSHQLLLKPGCKVVLKDLISKPELNNQLAIIEKYDDKKQRYQIKIEDTGAIIALKPQNLKQITDAFRRDGALVEPPTRLRVVGTQATSLELEWDEGDGGQWQLQWSCDGGLNWESASRNLEAPKVRKRNLSPGTHVIFRVRTIKNDRFSPWATCEGRTAQKSPEKSAFSQAVESDVKKRQSTVRQSHESDDSAARGLEDAFARASAWAASSPSVRNEQRWHELVKNSTGDTFFWNEASGETRWERDPAWLPKVDESGEEYWVSSQHSPGRSPGRRRSRFRSQEGATARGPPSFDEFLRPDVVASG